MSIRTDRVKVLQISLLAIFSAFVVEMVLGIQSNSSGLIADSIHALLECIVTGGLLIATKLASKPADSKHPYGRGKIELLGGLFGGVAILMIASFFMYETVGGFQDPTHDLHIVGILGMAGGLYTVGINIFRIILLHKSIKKIHEEKEDDTTATATLKADFYHAFVDLGSTALAVSGIVLVQIGFFAIDFVVALILGALLVILSIRLIYKTILDLIDVIPPELLNKTKLIIKNTPGVTDVKSILMRRVGDIVFVQATILLRADVSFDKAHKISTNVEKNIAKEIKHASIAIYFEPNWNEAPKESRIKEIALHVDGVKDVHNINTYTIDSKIFVNLHIMVQGGMNLHNAHKIADDVEQQIHKQLPNEIEHITTHIEPHVIIPSAFDNNTQNIEQKIRQIIEKYPELKNISRIQCLYHKDILKVEIDCSFDGSLSIQKVHDVTSEIEMRIKSQVQDAIITIHTEPAIASINTGTILDDSSVR